MKRHTLYGVEILGDSPRLDVARQIALSHHECWDGSGYPHGLTGMKSPCRPGWSNWPMPTMRCAAAGLTKPVLSGEEAYGYIVNGDASRGPARGVRPGRARRVPLLRRANG